MPPQRPLSASEGLSSPQDALRRSGRLPTNAPTAADAPAGPARSDRTSSGPSRGVRPRSASRVRAPAVLPPDGPTQAPKTSALAPVVGAQAEALAPPPLPKGKEKKRSSLPNPLADSINPAIGDRVRIPVRFAADCEMSDEQILAADDLRRAAANSAQFPSTGSASSGLPFTTGTQDPAPPPADVAAEILDEAKEAVEESASGKLSKKAKKAANSSATTEAPAVAALPPVVSAPVQTEAAPAPPPASKRSRTQKSSARFPVAIWDRAQEQAAAAAKLKSSTKALDKAKAIPQPIKVKQATFNALDPKDRAHFVAYTSSEEEEIVRISSESDNSAEQSDESDGAPRPSYPKFDPSAATIAADLKRQARPAAQTAESAKSRAASKGVTPDFVQEIILLVHPSSILGDCLFDSISSGLAHILKHDISAFGASSSRSAREGIQALTDPANLRSLICDHLEGPFADMPLECLHGQSPRRAVLQDYVAHGYPLFDHAWTPPAENPNQPHQFIKNYKEYIKAMRKTSACGDEICLAASADLLGLRHIVFDTRAQAILGAINERDIELSLDLTPEIEAPASRAERCLSSRMPLFLLRTNSHFDWMHCQSDIWNEPKDDPLLLSLHHVVARVFNPILEIRNPGGFEASKQPETTRHHRATPDVIMRPLPCKAIIERASQRRLRNEVLTHMVNDLGVPHSNAEAALLLFEQENCVTGGHRHASIRNLPDLMRLARVLDTNVDPLASHQPQKGPGYASPHGNTPSCNGCGSHSHRSPSAAHDQHEHLCSAERRARSRLANSAKFVPPATGPQPDRLDINRLGTFRERVDAATRPYSDFDSAVTALMTTANVSSEVSAAALRRHLVEGTSPLGEPLRRAFAELTAPAGQHKGGAPSRPIQTQILEQIEVDHELAASRAEFIAKCLRNGTRVMTAAEIMKASKDERKQLYTGAAADIVPLNLEKYWRHHQGQTLLTPRGHLPMAEYQRRIRALSAEALHQEACVVVERRQAAIRKVQQENEQAELAKLAAAPKEMNRAAEPAPGPAYATNSPAYDAPEHDPHTSDMSTPASAVHAPFIAPGQPRAFSRPSAPAALPINSSPAVCLAHDREQRRSAAENRQQIQIVVDTGMLPANSIIWKQGLEIDGAGFNYHAFSGVKASWEQANTDKAKSYHSFKSFVDARFIGTICSYIGVARSSYESTSDTELLQLIEAKLKPKDSTIYFVKINSLKISSAPTTPKDTLTMRYTAFADKFLATVNEAAEAGTPLLEETIKSAFKTACSVNPLLKMWLGAQKWTTVQATHQLIFSQLQTFEAHAIIKTLSESTGSTPAAPAGQVLAPPIAQPPPPAAAPAQQPATAQMQPRNYTPDQRREYALLKQQGLAQQQHLQMQQQQQQFAQQQQQQQATVNSMQQSVDAALQRLGQAQPQTFAQMQYAAPFAQAQLPAQMQYVAPIAQAQLPAQMQYAAPIAQAQLPVQMQFASPGLSPPTSVNYAQQNIAATPHPGLDARGPNWHVHGPHLGCSRIPCGSTLFCQGCGMHGHSSADCRRAGRHSKWNAQGYYSDRYPGAGPLEYEARPVQQAHPQPTPSARQQQLATPQPRIPPPPFQHQPAPAFPTPHKLNYMQRTPAATAPPATVNASTQAAAGGGVTGA